MYRDARTEIDELNGRDPFMDLRWPAAARDKPDPFLPKERDKILDFFREREPFYYPWVLLAFMAGTRPSEASALQVDDLDVETCEIAITKTRHLGVDNQPKTGRSRRTIRISREITESLLTLPSFSLCAESLFLNKYGGPLDANTWAQDYWPRTLQALEIRPRKFYATRHTFITEQVKRGELLKAIADYCGTSVQMIEDNYCGTLTLSDRTVFKPQRSKLVNSLVSPAGQRPPRDIRHRPRSSR
jgi:integrase